MLANANATTQNTTSLQGLPLCAAFDGLRRPFVVSHGWIPAFAGMTQAGGQPMP
jgi:hypothetical protein